MARLTQCDRCRATEPLNEPLHPHKWVTISVDRGQDADGYFLWGWEDVCPRCQTGAERAQREEQIRLCRLEDERWGTEVHP